MAKKRLKKGSRAAKEHMAKLRAMRKEKKPAGKKAEQERTTDPGPGRFLVG